MSDEVWSRALQLLRSKLKEVGRPDIVELSTYARREGLERWLPNEKTLVIEMLKALQNEMRARSPELVSDSLDEIRKKVMNGNYPTKIAVYRDVEYGEDDKYDIPSEDGEVTKANSDLRDLIEYLETYDG